MRDRSQLPDRIHNAYYDQDIRYVLQLCQWILKPIGLWHLIYDRSQSSRSEKFLSFVLILVCFFCLCFVIVPAGPYILFREKDTYTKIKLFGPFGFCLTSAIKYCFIGSRVSAIGRCVEYVECDWQGVRHRDHRRIMLSNAMVGRRLSILFMIFLSTGGLSYYTVMPLIAKTNSNLTIRPLVYPGYDIYYDSQASPAYEITFSMHFLACLVQAFATTAACSLAAIFAAHACGQVQILMTLLSDLVDGKRTKSTVEERLSFITKHHVRVLRFTNDIETVLCEICLMELVATTLLICLVQYYCLVEWANSDTVAIFTYFIILISLTFNILIFCYIGELLMEKFGKIGSAAYKVNWYDLPGHKAVDLVMMITMSHYPPKLTAGKFCDLSLNTFKTVMQTSIVYLNLLRTVME